MSARKHYAPSRFSPSDVYPKLRQRDDAAEEPHPRLSESLLHHLTYVRNLCAHHLRLWNRGFTITPAPPISFPSHVVASVERASPASRRIYNTLVLVAYMCGVIEGTK